MISESNQILQDHKQGRTLGDHPRDKHSNGFQQGSVKRCSRCGGNHLDKDCSWNTGACFACGEYGHQIAECSSRKESQTIQQNREPPTNRPLVGGRNKGGIKKPKTQDRVYALT